MSKRKSRNARRRLIQNTKYIFPIIVIAAVAVTFATALEKGRESKEEIIKEIEAGAVADPYEDSKEEEITIEQLDTNVVMEPNSNNAIYSLLATYYNAYALGDVETIKTLTNHFVDTDAIKIPEMAKYIESYPKLEIYTKAGPLENTYLVYAYYQMTIEGFEDAMSGLETFYVCTDENGNLYLNEGELGDVELEYIKTVNAQEDVEALYNRVNVECSETFRSNSDLFYYVQNFVNEVQKVTAEILASQVIEGEAGESAGETATEDGTTEVETEAPVEEVPAGPIYATTTTTVNIRASDSEQADRVGTANGGRRVTVLEQYPNGWSKVTYEKIEGYIKSEYLKVDEAVDASKIIGTVRANTTVNIRAAASQNASRIGLLNSGEYADLVGYEGDWAKIVYNNRIGYVKAEYVD